MQTLLSTLASAPLLWWVSTSAMLSLTAGLALYCSGRRANLTDTSVESEVGFQPERSSPTLTPRQQLLQKELAQAMRQETPFFHLLVQPVFRLSDNRLLGGEVLVRWQHEEIGFISPGEFIPVAELTGQIQQLDMLIFEASIVLMAELSADIQRQLKLSINASITHFNDVALLMRVLRLCHSHAVPATSLMIEVTEHSATDDLDAVERSMRLGRSHGIEFALDDFGTGYTSLRFLQTLPFSRVKLDQSFIRHVDDQQQSRRLVRAMVGLIEALNMQIVAEGIEEPRQLEQLRTMNCHAGQGYLLGYPLPFDEFRALAERSIPGSQYRGELAADKSILHEVNRLRH